MWYYCSIDGDLEICTYLYLHQIVSGRDCRSFGGRCCGIQAKPNLARFSLLLKTCFVNFHWFSLDFDWMIIRLEQRLTSLETAMKSSQNLRRSSSPLAHVSVDQMSNSTLLRWWSDVKFNIATLMIRMQRTRGNEQIPARIAFKHSARTSHAGPWLKLWYTCLYSFLFFQWNCWIWYFQTWGRAVLELKKTIHLGRACSLCM